MWGVCLSACWDTHTHSVPGPGHPPGVGLEMPPLDMGLDTPGCWSGDPPARPLNLAPSCGPGDPPTPDPLTSPLGVGLETPPARPLNLPPWVWAWTPPQARPSTPRYRPGDPPARPLNLPPGCGPGHPLKPDPQPRGIGLETPSARPFNPPGYRPGDLPGDLILGYHFQYIS